MAEPETCASFDATDRLVLRFAEQSTKHVRVDDALYAELARRFSKQELLELGMTVALAALVNRMHATFTTDLDPATQAAVGAPSCPVGR